jgi:hypothetical protein
MSTDAITWDGRPTLPLARGRSSEDSDQRRRPAAAHHPWTQTQQHAHPSHHVSIISPPRPSPFARSVVPDTRSTPCPHRSCQESSVPCSRSSSRSLQAPLHFAIHEPALRLRGATRMRLSGQKGSTGLARGSNLCLSHRCPNHSPSAASDLGIDGGRHKILRGLGCWAAHPLRPRLASFPLAQLDPGHPGQTEEWPMPVQDKTHRCATSVCRPSSLAPGHPH